MSPSRKSSDLAQSPLFFLFKQLCTNNPLFIWALTSSVLSRVFCLMPPFLIGWVIATLSHQPPAWIIYTCPSASLIQLALLLACLTFFIHLSESLMQWQSKLAFLKIAQNIQHSLRLKLYSCFQQKKMHYVETERKGHLLSIIHQDVNQLESFINNGINDIIQFIVLVLFSNFILFSTSIFYALLTLLAMPMVIAIGMLLKKNIAERYREVRESNSRFMTRLEDNLRCISVIKSFVTEKKEYQRIEAASQRYSNASCHAVQLSALFTPIVRIIIATEVTIVIYLGGIDILNNEFQIGELVTIVMILERLLWPLSRLGDIFDNFSRAKTSIKRILDNLYAPLDEAECLGEVDAQEQQINAFSTKPPTIEFRQVTFHYRPYQNILKNIQLTIEPGECVGIIGASGIGKSTLIKLLLRYYDVVSGGIYFNNTLITDYDLSVLRKRVALVSQDLFLLDGSIRENLMYGSEDIHEQKIIDVMKMVDLHTYIMTLPDGYDTNLAEHRITLSGGQKQRLCLGRALLKQADIYIFDEATNALDHETETNLFQKIIPFLKNKTLILVTHRYSLLNHVKVLYIMKNGTLVKQNKESVIVSTSLTEA